MADDTKKKKKNVLMPFFQICNMCDVMYRSCIQWDMIHLVFNSRAAQQQLLQSPVSVYNRSAQSVLLGTHKSFQRAHNLILILRFKKDKKSCCCDNFPQL